MIIANELIKYVDPVGYTWLTDRLQEPKLDLWQAGCSHPTEQGTYLAACLFYADIFRQSPENNSCQAQLSASFAYYLQSVASTIFPQS